MSIQKIATIIFLVAIGIWLIWSLAYTDLIAAIAGFIAAVAMVLEK